VRVKALLAAWLLILLGAVALILRYPALPDQIPLFRSFSGEAIRWGAKSWPVALRVVMLNAGQLLAVHAVLLEVRGHPGWLRFAQRAALAIGAKGLVEAIRFAGMPEIDDTPWARALDGATLGIAGAFALSAFLSWRKGELGSHPLGRGVYPGLIAGLLIWAGFAFAVR
jgi:hypothetical protein